MAIIRFWLKTKIHKVVINAKNSNFQDINLSASTENSITKRSNQSKTSDPIHKSIKFSRDYDAKTFFECIIVCFSLLDDGMGRNSGVVCRRHSRRGRTYICTEIRPLKPLNQILHTFSVCQTKKLFTYSLHYLAFWKKTTIF